MYGIRVDSVVTIEAHCEMSFEVSRQVIQVEFGYINEDYCQITWTPDALAKFLDKATEALAESRRPYDDDATATPEKLGETP
jgi:hypothetical protein